MLFGLTYKKRHTDWEPWFAWYPVKLQDGRWAWLHRIQRHYMAHYMKYEYGVI